MRPLAADTTIDLALEHEVVPKPEGSPIIDSATGVQATAPLDAEAPSPSYDPLHAEAVDPTAFEAVESGKVFGGPPSGPPDEPAVHDTDTATHIEAPVQAETPTSSHDPFRSEVADLTAFEAAESGKAFAEPPPEPPDEPGVSQKETSLAGEQTLLGDEPSAAGLQSSPSAGAPPEPRRSAVPMTLGVVILALLAGIAYLLLTESQRTGSAELTAEVGKLKDQVAALEARPQPAPDNAPVAALDGRTKDLAGQLATLRADVADLGGKVEAVSRQAQGDTTRIAALEQKGGTTPVTSAQPAASSTEAPPSAATPSAAVGGTSTAETPAPAPAAELSALTAKVDELDKRIAVLPTPLAAGTPTAAPAVSGPQETSPSVTDLAGRIDTLQASVAALPKVDLAPIEAQLDDLSKRLTAANQANAAMGVTLAAIPKIDLTPLKDATAELDKRVGGLESSLSTPKAGDRVTEVRAVGDSDTSRAAPLAVVAQTVGQAVEDGRPFSSELQALKALGVDGATLAPLVPLAAKGAPTMETLKTQWSAAEPDVLKAIRPQSDNVFGRFAANARSLVEIHPVGAAPAGDEPSALTGRIDAAMERGDLSGALAEWAKLPDAGRAESQTWADSARSRLDAGTAAQGLVSRAITMLGKAGE